MAEKRFDTRILLKYDSLDNWNSSELILKAGEVAIAAVSVDGAAASPVVIKVGDGTRKFRELEMVSALASDVYSWAKQDEAAFVKWLDETKGFATDAEVTAVRTALEARDEELQDAIDLIKGEGGTEGGLAGVYVRVAELEKILNSFLPEGDAEATLDAVKNAIDAVDAKIGARSAEGVEASGVYADIEAIEGEIATLKGNDTALGNRIAENERKLAGIGDAETVKGLIDGIASNVETISGDLDKVEDKLSDVNEGQKVGALISGAKQDAKDYTDGKFGEATSAITGLTTRVEANEGAIATLKGGSEVEGSVAHTVAAEIAKVVAGAPEDFDTLKEVADWIANDTTGSAQMQTDIANLKTTTENHATTIGQHTASINELNTGVESLNSGLSALSETVSGMTGASGVITLLEGRVKANEDAIDALEAKDTEFAGELTSIKNDVSANANAIKAEKERAEGVEATLLEKVNTAQAKAESVETTLSAAIKAEQDRAIAKENEIAGSVSALDNSLAAIAKTGSVADLVQPSDVEIIFDCGNAAGKTVIAG